MTRQGDYILVDSADLPGRLTELMDDVARHHRQVRIVRNGKPVAELLPAQPPSTEDPLRQHPELMSVRLTSDAFAPADDEEWPTDCR